MMQKLARTAAIASGLTLGLVFIPGQAHAAVRVDRSIPPIKEPFSRVPCTGRPNDRTQLQLDRCAEDRVLTRDRTVEITSRRVAAQLSPSGYRTFVIAGRRWVAYRDEFCRSAASVAAGGTESPLLDLTCLGEQDSSYTDQLRRSFGSGSESRMSPISAVLVNRRPGTD